MKFLLFCFFAFLLGFAATTDEKIKEQKISLQSSQDLEKQLNKKLDDLADDIVKGEANLKDIDSKMTVLQSQIKDLELSSVEANKELGELNSKNSQLLKNQKGIEENMIKIIADDFSFDLIIPKEYEESSDSIIADEILSKLNLVVRNDFENLAKNYENTLNLIRSQNSKINDIEQSLKLYRQKKSELANLQNSQTKLVANLRRDNEIYKNQLSRLQNQQNEIRKTLEDLKIIAKQEIEEAKRAEEAAKKAQKEAQRQAANNTKSNKTKAEEGDVKQLGSSYQESQVKKYTGTRTIAPLDSFTVKQKFGNYTDPIYNIKIFNESVVLSSNTPDAKVKSVLNGKVVFAKQTPLLDSVVIIENSDGIHTIYAHLSQIAPTIKVGTKVQQGYVIGRVERDLTFEVTQKSYHIDPLQMISLK
ncbi:MAG: murein hydrolase activator EnvC family protein [Campylobacter sp.]